MTTTEQTPPPYSLRHIFRIWWPLALGWLMMTVEIPMLAAIVARTPDPKIHLAAWGVTFPLAMILGSPAIVILAASTTLSKDWVSFCKVRRYMLYTAGLMLLLHFLLAFTPLYDLIVIELIGPPAEVVEPARLGLQLMLPYVIGLAYRRLNNGVLIRFGHARVVAFGVVTRLGADAVVLAIFYLIGGVSGIVIATVTFTIGVIAEAIYSGLRIRPVLRKQLQPAPAVENPLTLSAFLRFYIPLVMTVLLQVAIQPIMSSALSRMPNPLDSLAVWPVVYGFLMIWMSAGMAYVEVVVVTLDEARSLRYLYRFTLLMAGIITGLLALVTATPLAGLWFIEVSALAPALVTMALPGLWLLLPLPTLRIYQSLYEGTLMNGRRTQAITESVIIYIAVTIVVLGIGVVWQPVAGLYIALAATTVGGLVRTMWLWHRARPILREKESQAAQSLRPALQHS